MRNILALTLLFASSVSNIALAQSGCEGRFMDSIGQPGVNRTRAIAASIDWDPDGPGPAKPLLVIATYGAGAGYSFGGGVFAYDGAAWRPLGLGIPVNESRRVNSLAVFRGELYAAGSFITAERPGPNLNGLARWDGAVWQPVPGNPFPSAVGALFVHDDNLFASSLDTTLNINGQNAGGVVRFDGTNWHAVGDAPTGITCFGSFRNQLIAGGAFTSWKGSTFNNIVRWNGSAWVPLGATTAGTNQPVSALQEFENDLYVGGSFTSAGGSIIRYLARWNGTAWSGIPAGEPNAPVYALLNHGDALYIGGGFIVVGNQSHSQIAALENGAWRTLASNTISTNSASPRVTTFASVAGRAYVAGSFPGIDVPGVDGGFGNIASIPSTTSGKYERLHQINGVYLAGMTSFQGDLYSYGIFTYDTNNLASPSLAKLVSGRWQIVGGSLGPAYAPGNDVTFGRLRAATEFQGKLAFVGTFQSVDGVAAHYVAAYDGSNWSAVVPESVWASSPGLSAIETFEGSLILAGQFTGALTAEGAANNIARWDGTQLHSMGTIPSAVRVVRSRGGTLYAGTSTDAYRWDGTDWIAMRSATNIGIANVNDFAFYNETLIAEADAKAYSWNGSAWTTINTGGSAEKGGLIEYAGRLHRFGAISQGSTAGYNIRAWSGSGAWRGLGTTSDYRVELLGTSGTILTCAAIHNGELYLGGYVGQPAESGLSFGTPKGIIVARYTTDTLPRFEGNPTNQIFTLNQEARLQASLQPGVERPSIVSFQWQRNGAPIANGAAGASPGGGTVQGATSATLHIFGVQASDAGSYTLIATSSCGTQTSGAGQLQVRLIPQDINADGFVNDADFELFVQQYDVMVCADPAMPDGCTADFNADGIVDDADFALFIPAYDALIVDGR